MKIALFTDGIFPYVIGGMQTHSFNLAKHLARNRVYVDLYHCNSSTLDISKLELFSEDEKKYIHSVVLDFPVLSGLPGHYIRESYEYSQRIFNLFRKNSEVDFIYAKGFTAWKLLDEKRKGYACAPVGVNFHGYEMFQKAASFRSKLEQVLLLRKPVIFNVQNSDYLFSYGGGITDIILKLGVQKEKIIELPAGIDRDWMVPGATTHEGPRRFVFVGRQERRKGIDELTEVLKELMVGNNFQFTFVGDIEESARISSPLIEYTGKITDRDRLKKVLRESDVLVCPSYSEGMPNVILEAMASGLAILATDVGAVGLLVSRENGWLIDAGNKTGLKQALTEAIGSSSPMISEMKGRSVEKARAFLWEDVISRLIAEIAAKTGKN